MNFRSLIALFTIVSLAASCGVPQKKHDEIVSQLKAENAELKQENQEIEATLEAHISELETQLAGLEARAETLQNELDEAHATISMYESKTGGLEAALKVTKEDIDALRKQRAQALKRLREYRQLAKKLAGMIEAGQLAVKIRNNKMVLQMPNAILFDSGKTEIKADGREALEQVAEALQTVEDRSFLVAGHTDNVPIKVSGFESNWELSTARAVKVLHLLQDTGVDPDKLAAAGFGEFDPVASNETEEGRAQNRRTEIVLMPRIEELPELPEDLFEKSS